MKKGKHLIQAILLALVVACAVPTVVSIPGTTITAQAAAKISKKKATLIKGQTLKLKISGTKKKVTWSSNKKKVATVNKNGKVTAKKKGNATITAKVGSKTFKCKVTVENPKISKTSLTVKKGKTATLEMTGTSQKVKWKSSDTSVATVSSSGKVKGIKKGTATITATVLGKKYKCTVTVKKSTSSSSGSGTREDPRSAYSAYTTDIYQYGTYLGKFKIQLLDYKDGTEAYNYVMQYPYNTAPSSNQEYIYVKFKIDYISGSNQVNATSVVNYYSNFFNSSSNLQLENLNWASNFENVENMVLVNMYPGASVTCSAAILVRSGNTPLTYRLETGFNSNTYQSEYTWFTTKK